MAELIKNGLAHLKSLRGVANQNNDQAMLAKIDEIIELVLGTHMSTEQLGELRIGLEILLPLLKENYGEGYVDETRQLIRQIDRIL